MNSSFLEVFSLIMFLIIPVTGATVERSFSKFKIIKNSIGQERLSNTYRVIIHRSRRSRSYKRFKTYRQLRI
jgi:hypothetical protein